MDRRALLINDSRFESLILKDMLQDIGYTVEIADEFEALYAIEKHEPDLVIVNYIMQHIKGDKLIQLMKAGMPSVKCILSSSNNINLSDFSGGFIDGIIHIPVSRFLLKSVIENLEHKEKTIVSKLCSSCSIDLSPFNDIVFCPFCGSEV